MKTIFKLYLGLETRKVDPRFEWIEYFSTKKKMDNYIKKYKRWIKKQKDGEEITPSFGLSYDYGYSKIKLDTPTENLEENE